MRRLPIYFLIDISESMVGTPVEQVQEGMRNIIQELRVDPYALETVFVSIIAFAGKAKVLSPLTELYMFYPPAFPIGGGTALGKGLECLMDDMERNVRKNTAETKGDWKPIIFLFTDGIPTDDYSAAFRRWNEHFRRHCNLVAISLGDEANILTLAQITNEILILKDTRRESFREFFKWVTDSIKTSSLSISEHNSDEVKLAPTKGINLEKVDAYLPAGTVDENFAVLHARCQHTKQDYLIKYARRIFTPDGKEFPDTNFFKLVGAYPIDHETYASLSMPGGAVINTRRLSGVPTCPCCGNQHGAVICECGKLFCVGDSTQLVCPWCGMEGELGEGGSDEGFNIDRSIG